MRRPRPDTRLSWRDPDMPVLRDYKMGDGSIKNIVDQDYERRYRDFMLNASPHLSYKDDPTYNLRKKR